MSSNHYDSANIPTKVAAPEELARSVFSQRHVKEVKGKPHKVLFRAFEPPRDPENAGQRVRELSVDRLGYLDLDTAIRLTEARAKRRSPDTNFHGWAILLAQDAAQEGREVISSEAWEEQNPAHADIRLPLSTVDDDEDRHFHISGLAEKSCWVPRPPVAP